MHKSLIAIAAAGALIGGFASGAQAADLPARMPAKAPVYAPPPPFSWTGLYVGGNLGWGWANGDGTIAFGGPTSGFSGSGDGFLGGGQIGYNWQTGNVVFGVETDFQGSAGSSDITATPGAATITGTAKNPWFGTIRGRLGYAFDRSMLYATGGAVYGKNTFEGTNSVTGPFSSSATYWSWTVGAGYEAMLWDRWSAKIEYLYVGTPSDTATPPGTSIDGDAHANIVRVGLNYHF
jgi:outer membrane immunogenic protein